MWTLAKKISKIEIPVFKGMTMMKQLFIKNNIKIKLFHKSDKSRGHSAKELFFASLRYRIPLCYMDLFKKDI